MVQIYELLGNRNFVKLLLFFLRKPTLRAHQQAIKKEVKMAKGTLIKCLKHLVGCNILSFTEYGRIKVYSLNRSSEIVKRLKALDSLLVLAPLHDIAEKHGVNAYMYGSAARGDDTEESDIDIILIGKLKKEDIISDINKLSAKIGRQISVNIFAPALWARAADEDPAFYERVEKDKVEI